MTLASRPGGAAPASTSQRLALGVVAGLVLAVPLTSCGSGTTSSGTSTPGLSGSDRAATAGVCVNVSGEVATAVSVGVKLATQTVTPAKAQQQLQPILTKVTAVAKQNPSLPVGAQLGHLATAISTAENASANATQLKAAANDIGSAAKGVLNACAAVAQ